MVQTGQWSCIALTFSGQQCALYLNGRQVAQNAGSLTADLKDQPMTFAGVAGAHHQFKGLIDEFRVYDPALTPEQVATISDATQALQTVPPIPSERGENSRSEPGVFFWT